MKKKIYRICFTIRANCGGIVSWMEGHSSVIATSESEAREAFKEKVRFGDAGYHDLGDAISITSVEFIYPSEN